eukprot:6490911-Amphidinium_carterae.1
MIPQGLTPDLARVFVNSDEMIAACEKKPRVFPTRPIQGPSLAPTTVSLTTPYSWSEWNPEQYGSLPSDLAIQQGEMLQMMWNHTRIPGTKLHVWTALNRYCPINIRYCVQVVKILSYRSSQTRA